MQGDVSMSSKKEGELRKEKKKKRKKKEERSRMGMVTHVCYFIDICTPAQKRPNDICVAVLSS